MATRIRGYRWVLALAWAVAWAGCESSLFSEVVDVERGGPPPRQVFASLSTADTVWRVWVNEGLRSDEDGPPELVAGATVTLVAGGDTFGPFPVDTASVYVGFPTDQTGEFDVFEVREVYALRAPRSLRPGEEIALTVDLPDGQTVAWSRTMPEAPRASLVAFAPSTADTAASGRWTYTFPEVTVALPRGSRSGVNYYRAQVRYDYYAGDRAIARTYGRGFPVYDGEADRERAFAPYVTTDEGVRGDTLRQTFQLQAFSGFDIRFRRDDLVGGDVDSVRASVVVEAIDLLSARFYADLEEAKRAEQNFFAEPIVLGSQVEGVIGHLVVGSSGAAGEVTVF